MTSSEILNLCKPQLYHLQNGGEKESLPWVVVKMTWGNACNNSISVALNIMSAIIIRPLGIQENLGKFTVLMPMIGT